MYEYECKDPNEKFDWERIDAITRFNAAEAFCKWADDEDGDVTSRRYVLVKLKGEPDSEAIKFFVKGEKQITYLAEVL